ncbi:MAG: ATP-binding protein, partial [Acholeplasma sp.]|nr:ATP-binding protein [Acholeplasma sp.]
MSLEFTMSAFALKLLGKNLYTNPWSALSELVANSLDAKALEVKLIFNKHSSSGLYDIYIIDNGTGMNEFDLENKYAKIGYPKRKDQEYMDDNTVMGRKGIGKLAALFLSNNYDILTRKDKELFYTFNFEDSINPDSDYKPRLLDCPTYKKDDIMLANIDSNNPYTCIYIKEVNFKGYAQRSFEAMANRLSYFFSYDLIKSKISISHYEDNLLSSSTEVKKKIAFKNLIALKLFGYNAIPKAQYDDLLANPIVKLPKSDNNQPLIKEREINTADEFDVEIPSLNKKGKLWGWIGIHSTIEEKDAVELNDDRFTRNLKVFNPIQLRIYVRNKLAIDDYFEVYRNTQTFSNYIEGELHFDILDDNELDDIANTNRQGMVKNDPRMIELNVYIEKMISDLILKRKNIKDELDEDKNKSIQNQNTQAKNKAKDNFETNLKLLLDSEDGTKINEDFKSKFSQRVVHNFSMQLQGEAKAKEKYSLFFSHRSKSKVFSDFVYDILIKLGADKNEIFYTSRSGRIEDLEQTIISNI